MDDWLILFRRARAIMDAAPPGSIHADWTIGGGTMLYRRFGHRLSHDIDIFLPSPQALPALSPRLNDEAARRLDRPGTSYVEQSNFLKLSFPEGEVDFIVAPHLLDLYAEPELIDGTVALVETPAEILAKKVLYRADDFTARDLFDMAFLIGTGDARLLLATGLGLRGRLDAILVRLDTAGAALSTAFAGIAARAFRPSFEEAERTVRAFLAH